MTVAEIDSGAACIVQIQEPASCRRPIKSGRADKGRNRLIKSVNGNGTKRMVVILEESYEDGICMRI